MPYQAALGPRAALAFVVRRMTHGTGAAPWAHEEDTSSAEGAGSDDVEIVSLEALYRNHSPKLERFLNRRTLCREEARDLLQDVFCRLAGRRSPAAIKEPEGYLTRIAANLLKDRAKIAVRRSTALHRPFDEERFAGTDPVHLLECRDILSRLEAAMLKLKPRTREIFMAHRLDGLTYGEIAARTGLSVKGVEKQMAKAIAQIDRFLHKS